MRHLLLSLTFCLLSTAAFSQSRTLTGSVKNQSGEPLFGARVIVEGTTNGIATDDAGNFELEVNDGAEFLNIGYIGYADQ